MADSLKKQTKKGLYWKFAEQFSKYGIQFIISIFMARLLSPSDYGITALPAVFMAVAGIFTEGGFAKALIRKEDLKEEDLSTAYIYSMCVGVLCYLILFFASPWIADFYNTPVLKSLMRVTALGFLYHPIGTPQNVLMQRNMNFKTIAKISVSVSIIGGVVGIVLAFIGLGVWALVISGMVSDVIKQTLKIIAVRWYPKTGWSKESFKYLWDYGNKMMASALLDTLYSNITPIFIGKYYSTAQLGLYNRARHYAQMPSKNVTGTLSSVTFPALSKMQNDNEKLEKNYRKMIRVAAFIVFPMMIMLSALARPLVLIMISSKWESCIILLQIICFSMMWYPIHALNLNLLQVKGRSDLFLRLEVIKKITGGCILAITLPLGLIPLCCGSILSSMISLIINTFYTGKLINCGYWKQMRDLAPTLLLSLIVWGACQGLLLIDLPIWTQLLIGLTAGLTIYIGGAFIFKFPELKEVKYLLSKK